MDFDFSPEQYLFRDSVRQFLDDWAGDGHAGERADSASVSRLWSGLADLGVFSMLVPEQYGGLGMSLIDITLILEELGSHLAPSLVVDTLVATFVLASSSSDEQKKRVLPLVAQGECRISIAVSEQKAGYDTADMGTVISNERGSSILNGAKIMVSGAAAGDFLLLAARAGGAGDIRLVLIEPTRAGIELRKHTTIDLSSDYYQVTARNVALSERDFIAGDSATALHAMMDASAIAAAILMTAMGAEVLEQSLDYVKQRSQFGQVVGSFQVIKHRCAEMAMAVESSRSAAYYGVWALATGASDRFKAVSIAKSFCGDKARYVCTEGIQLHGGMGFTWDIPLHRYLRRAKLLECSFGDAAHHRKRVISEALSELLASAEVPGTYTHDRRQLAGSA